MRMIRNIIFLLGGVLILMSSKCAQTKSIVKDSSEAATFKIINAYTQKMVPGERGKKAYIEFGFEVKGLSKKVVLDSVFCEVGQSININADGKNRLKLLIDNQKIDQLKYDKAIFFYKEEGTEYQFVLNDIKIKEPIHLP